MVGEASLEEREGVLEGFLEGCLRLFENLIFVFFLNGFGGC